MSAAAALGLCIALAAGGPPLTRLPLDPHLPLDRFTLAWTHSVERIRWREDWIIGTDGRLHAGEAVIEGSGAGMEPPDDARLIDGRWVYTPHLPPQDALTLANSTMTGPHDICIAGRCRSLFDIAPGARNRPVRLFPCPGDALSSGSTTAPEAGTAR